MRDIIVFFNLKPPQSRGKLLFGTVSFMFPNNNNHIFDSKKIFFYFFYKKKNFPPPPPPPPFRGGGGGGGAGGVKKNFFFKNFFFTPKHFHDPEYGYPSWKTLKKHCCYVKFLRKRGESMVQNTLLCDTNGTRFSDVTVTFNQEVVGQNFF